MNATSCPTSIRLGRPLHERLRDAVTDRVRQVVSAWLRGRAERRHRRELETIAEMNEMLLRDIGAPESLIAEAAARDEARRLIGLELRREQGIGRLRGLQ
ncbi:MAG TPA: hypothetical protein VJ743_01335 [Albitalea sp.]|nr:hypothetical protein [Albitalea sp.]